MKNILKATALSSILLLSGCASIVSKTNWPITINSTPSEANISITDKKGLEVYSGSTPATLKLKSGSGFFGKASYQIKFEKEGYDIKVIPIQFKLNGWYFGNLLLGGVIGMLIVDPATGAMYRIETDLINETLKKKESVKDTLVVNELQVLDIKDVPIDLRRSMVKIN